MRIHLVRARKIRRAKCLISLIIAAEGGGPRQSRADWAWRSSIERAADTFGAEPEDVRIDHCRRDVAVTQKLLHRADVVALLRRCVATNHGAYISRPMELRNAIICRDDEAIPRDADYSFEEAGWPSRSSEIESALHVEPHIHDHQAGLRAQRKFREDHQPPGVGRVPHPRSQESQPG